MIDLSIEGVWGLRKLDRRTGLWTIHEPGSNAVDKARLIDLLMGASTNHVDATSILQISPAIGFVPQLNPMDTGFPDRPGTGQLRGRWTDSSAEVYTPEIMDADGGFSSVDVTSLGWGEKQAFETWEYTWTLTLSSAPVPGTGVNLFRDLVGNFSSDHLTNACDLFVSPASVTIPSTMVGYPLRNGTQQLHLKFSIPAGTATGGITTYQVRSPAGVAFFDQAVSQNKGAGEEYQERFIINF